MFHFATPTISPVSVSNSFEEVRVGVILLEGEQPLAAGLLALYRVVAGVQTVHVRIVAECCGDDGECPCHVLIAAAFYLERHPDGGSV